LTSQLIELNLTPVTPSEFLSVGRWAGVLGQVDWVISKVTEEWAEHESVLPLARRAPVEDSPVMKELLEIKLFYKENDSAAGRLRQQQELEAQKAAREEAICAEEQRDAQLEAARQAELRYQQQRAADEDKIRSLAHLRDVLSRELGLPLPLAAAHMVVCNSATLALLVELNRLVESELGGEGEVDAGQQQQQQQQQLVTQIKALAADKKALSQQIVALNLGVLVPQDMPALLGAGMGAAAHTGNTNSIVGQIDWLVVQVRALQVADAGAGGASMQVVERGEEEEKAPAVDFAGTIDEASKQLLAHIVRLQEELGATYMASLHTSGSPAWRRDRVLACLLSLRHRLLGDGREQQLAKAHGLLNKLEDMKRALAAGATASANTKGKTQDQLEEEEKTAYFAAKAQRLLEEEEQRRAQQEAERLTEQGRLQEEERRRKQDALRKPEPAGGHQRGRRTVGSAADLNSAAKFRDAMLGLGP